VRVTLRDGTYHEDVGCGEVKNLPSKAAAIQKVRPAHFTSLYTPTSCVSQADRVPALSSFIPFSARRKLSPMQRNGRFETSETSWATAFTTRISSATSPKLKLARYVARFHPSFNASDPLHLRKPAHVSVQSRSVVTASFPSPSLTKKLFIDGQSMISTTPDPTSSPTLNPHHRLHLLHLHLSNLPLLHPPPPTPTTAIETSPLLRTTLPDQP
jgi:hypothetical protein